MVDDVGTPDRAHVLRGVHRLGPPLQRDDTERRQNLVRVRVTV